MAPERRYRLTGEHQGCGALLKKLGGGKEREGLVFFALFLHHLARSRHEPFRLPVL